MEGKRVAILLLVATLAVFLASCRVKADKVDVPYVVGVNANGFYGESKAGADCCDRCGCVETLPVQCFCNDIKSYCPPSCVKCGCTKSIPPQCKCADVNPSFCSTPCRLNP